MKISIVNHSTLANDSDLIDIATSVNDQIVTDVTPAWKLIDASVWFNIDSPDYIVNIIDDPLLPLLDGQHSSKEAWVCIRPSILHKHPYSVYISHEVIESLVDPLLNKWSNHYAVEVCDPVEQSYYVVNGIPVSNFVLPAYYDLAASGPYDQLKRIKTPLTPLLGGYMVNDQGRYTWGYNAINAMPYWRWIQVIADNYRNAKRVVQS